MAVLVGWPALDWRRAAVKLSAPSWTVPALISHRKGGSGGYFQECNYMLSTLDELIVGVYTAGCQHLLTRNPKNHDKKSWELMHM